MDSSLGISISTRSLGLAILYKTELVHYGIKNFNGRWNKRKLESMTEAITDLVNDYGISKIALKLPHDSHRSSNIQELVDELSQFFQARQISATPYTIRSLKKGYLQTDRSNKQNLIDTVVRKFPELQLEYSKQSKKRKPYFAKLFEAIACAELGETGQ